MRETLQSSRRYRLFVMARDRALERVHQNAQTDLSRITFEALDNIERLAAALAAKAEGSLQVAHAVTLHFQAGIHDILSKTFPILLTRMIGARRAVFILTYASEQEAIGRATQKRPIQPSRDEFKIKIQKAISEPTLLGPLDKRVWLALMKLEHRISLSFTAAVFAQKKPADIVAATRRAFPRLETYKRPPKALSKLREADSDDEPDQSWLNLSFIDDEDWNDTVDAYKDTELPASRFDNFAADETGRYKWELEQEATEDFVRQVREGTVAAAEDMGVKEFVWVAIIDKSTDDCCIVRNGKTTEEIEAIKDEYKAKLPPAHFNCRCQAAPVASTNEVRGPNWQSFNDWLNS